MATALYVPPALYTVGERLYAFWRMDPLCEHSILIVSAPLLVWLACLRAAMGAPRDPEGGERSAHDGLLAVEDRAGA